MALHITLHIFFMINALLMWWLLNQRIPEDWLISHPELKYAKFGALLLYAPLLIINVVGFLLVFKV